MYPLRSGWTRPKSPIYTFANVTGQYGRALPYMEWANWRLAYFQAIGRVSLSHPSGTPGRQSKIDRQMNKWIAGAGLTALGLVAIQASRLSAFSKKFVLLVSPRVHTVSFSRLLLAFDCTFKNPTDARLRLKHPTVYVYDSQANLTANEPIFSTVISAAQYTIGANSETKLKPIMLPIEATLQTGRFILRMISDVLLGKAATVYIRVLSQVNGTVGITQDQQSTFQLGKPAINRPLPTPTTPSGPPPIVTPGKSLPA